MFEMLIGKSSDVVVGPPPGVEFLGEQSVTGFINGTALASAIGLTGGIAEFSNEPWLHFIIDDVELYVAKKPYRRSTSWDQIHAAGAVFGDKTITINGRKYKVRLLKSVASGDEYTGGNNVFDPPGAYGSEWNRLFYSIHSGTHIDTRNPTPVSGDRIRLGTLKQYTDANLMVHSSAGNASRSWCQEALSTSPGTRVLRGLAGVSYLTWSASSGWNSHYGWRPVLELIE